MGKKAGSKRPATKLDKAIAEARSEVDRRKKQLADATRALVQLEARRPASKAVSPEPAVAGATAATTAAAKKPVPTKPPVEKPAARRPATRKPATRKPATRMPAVTKPPATSRRGVRTSGTGPGPTKTP